MPNDETRDLAQAIEGMAARLGDPIRMRIEREVAGQHALVTARAQVLMLQLLGMTFRDGLCVRDVHDVRAIAARARSLADEADVLCALLEGRQ